MLEFLTFGFNQHDLASLSLRALLGSFFIIAGYHKLFVPERHAAIVQTLKDDGVYNPVNEWLIPTAEFLGGIAILVGVLTIPATLGLMIICLGAVVVDGVKRIPAMKPLNKFDEVTDYEYLPEVLYVVMLGLLVLGHGAGKYSFDHLAYSQLAEFIR